MTSVKYGMRDDRQAEAGSIPRRQTGPPRQLSDVRLGQLRFVQRTAYAELARRLPPRTVIAPIVGVAAVGNCRNSALARDRRQVRVELVLAEVAAVCGIGPVFGASHL